MKFISYERTKAQKTSTWPTWEGQHIYGFSGVFHCSESCCITTYGCDMCHNHFLLVTENVPSAWTICFQPISFRDFTELLWPCHMLRNCLPHKYSFQKVLSTWGLTTEVWLVLRGDFLFLVSCFLSQLSSKNLPIYRPHNFKGWGDMVVGEGCHCTIPIKCWDAFKMTLLDFRY